MVDFGSWLDEPEIPQELDPIEIYESLDRRSITGPLRPAQKKVLTEWYERNKEVKDLIIKLHTGNGKTLIGLLILQSKINSHSGPCLFLCPNKYLVDQVIIDARKFGIKVCRIGEDKSLPNEFLDGERILVTHVQKLFNGKSVFGLGNSAVDVGTVVMDDSHACIDAIRNSFTITIKNSDAAYTEILGVFAHDIEEQGHGTYREILDKKYDSFLPIPYWSWIDKIDDVISVLSKYKKDLNQIKYPWPLIKDDLKTCQAFISGESIEISPLHIPIEKFASFHNSSQRILMSATTQDDSFFIRGLGFDPESIKKPLTNSEQKWSGEKMLIIPSLIDERIERDMVVNIMAKPYNKTYGVVSLVSSFSKSKQYQTIGAISPNSDQITGAIKNLKSGNYKETVVFTNRYDGIDLPDETCRILIIDSKPFFNSLSDRYEETNRKNSDAINIKIAQKIEQGLGRSVRGEKDYSLILIIGNDLVQFIKSSKTKKYFSSQTQKQIELGLQIAKMASNEVEDATKDPFDVVRALMIQSLDRDKKWKTFYKREMDKIEESKGPNQLYEPLILEKEAFLEYYSGSYERAIELIKELINNYCDDGFDEAWYLQMLARITYSISKSDSSKIQKSAFRKNHELLKPLEGVSYKKMEFISENRIKRISAWIRSNGDYNDMMLNVNSVLSDLQFGVKSQKFETALKEVGLMLGFLSERPDKEFKKGPDNLWCIGVNQYLLFECKSEVNESRASISKKEAGQMNNHCGWFKTQYGDAEVKPLLLIPTINLAYEANFTHEVEIIRKGKLRDLRNSIKSFFKEFSKFELKSITEEKINELLLVHRLDVKNILNIYSEKYYKMPS